MRPTTRKITKCTLCEQTKMCTYVFGLGHGYVCDDEHKEHELVVTPNAETKKYDWISDPEADGLRLIRFDDLFGLLAPDGKERVPCEFDDIQWPDFDGTRLAFKNDEKYSIAPDGKITKLYSLISNFSPYVCTNSKCLQNSRLF